MTRRIIINADDFGLCTGINKAIQQAHKHGVLTSATIMTNMPAAEEALNMAKKMPNLGIGVHLNLCKGRPLSKEPEVEMLLNADGQFAASLLRLSLLSVIKHRFRNAIRTELACQIQWLIDKGITPTHLDSHKNFHAFPPIFPIVCKLARRFKINAIRYSYEPKQLCQLPWPLPTEGGKKRANRARALALINRLQNAELLKTNAMLGIAHMGRIDVNFFKAVTLYSQVEPAEIATHPGFPEEIEPQMTSMLHQRKGDLDALCSERTKQYFQQAGTELIHFGHL
jgi:predicted glycoside hydrolase/deacetylase ChbG (UPF0249 family)